ncbi:uncharacterized protein LOC114755989 [Neltuma alba]|uniref:uncharacterized protein LOC114755989 n=1 Tax=Neltuma alba TaxID=207710 RepID=UPI0010A41996|nr:uncharacterized protein LOC114755989 [Prosopis alba]
MPGMLKHRPVAAHHRLLSCITSGSQHSGDVHEEDALCLSELVHDFLQDNVTEGRSSENNLDSERADSVSECDDLIMGGTFSWKVRNNVDPYRKQLLSHVSEAVEMFWSLRRNVPVFRRNVVAFLQEKGHNAAICETKWDCSGGVIAGNHEFIDVERRGSSTWQTRYLVEVEFTSQFEIARPTRKYEEILSSVPRSFVGRADELRRTVRVVCDVAEQSFECAGLSVPPWRKTKFMQNKWLAPYRRITNRVQGIPVPAAGEAIHGANCRSVGFYDIVSEAGPVGASVRTR